MRFEAISPLQNRSFKVIYRLKDHALDSVPKPNESMFTSLCFNEVQVELNESGLAEYVWGYCPRQSWQPTDCVPPDASRGELRVVPDKEFIPGVSVTASEARLSVFYNEQKNWLCFGNPSAGAEFRIKLAPGLVVVGNSSLIMALWVRIDRFDH